MKHTMFLVSFLMLVPGFSISPKTGYVQAAKATTFEASFKETSRNIYNRLSSDVDKPRLEVFENALKGFLNLKENGQLAEDKNLLTIVDFSLSSKQKRLWVIDVKNLKVLYNTLVAHGRNSGVEFAREFSNKAQSFQSSLGFYTTAETYTGKHGLSLRLDGLEPGYNHRARERAIVMHGANYATKKFVKLHGRLGRSLGCPAVPRKISDKLVKLLSGGNCLFIYHTGGDYLRNSVLLNKEPSATSLLAWQSPGFHHQFSGKQDFTEE